MQSDLTDIAYTPEESAARGGGMGAPQAEGPQYHWGTQLSLDDATLKKLGVDTAALGEGLEEGESFVRVEAVAKVSGYGISQRAGEENRKNLDLQITHMKLVPLEEDEKKEEDAGDAAPKKSPADALYGKPPAS